MIEVFIDKNPKYFGADVVARARSKIGTAEYNLFGKNCEHFATWCIEGFGSSSQVNEFSVALMSSGTVALLIGLMMYLKNSKGVFF